jgi:hypothetical protein
VSAASIPLGDAPALRGLLRRTRLVRLALALALLATGVTALALARTTQLPTTPLLPPGSRGVLVLDLSASTENASLDRMYAVLTQLSHSNGRFGLVVFSSRAYEALAPNTPARELGPVARFFTPLRPRTPVSPSDGRFNAAPTQYPTNPWASSFSFGTAISQGLELARTILLQNSVEKPAVWLVSDLADSAPDKPLVATAAREYVNAGIALHVIGLAPTKSDAAYFSRLVGPRGSLIVAKPSTSVRLHPKHPFPTGFAAVALVLAALLALNELLSAPLRWGAEVAA